MHVYVYLLVTSWCSGGELRVKMKSVFRSSNGWFERRPHFLLVQLLQNKTAAAVINLIIVICSVCLGLQQS